jgi:hypothetical protein
MRLYSADEIGVALAPHLAAPGSSIVLSSKELDASFAQYTLCLIGFLNKNELQVFNFFFRRPHLGSSRYFESYLSLGGGA